jgi:membrane-associated phospholipid phosphatase
LRVSRRGVVFAILLCAYVLLTLGVIFKSPVLRLDTDLVNLHLRQHHPEWKSWIYYYVMFGQRGPATLLFLPYFAWVAWRRRTMQPLVMLGSALVLLNLSVGVVKIATGRISPLRTHNAHDVFVGGNIFPSGHVSNTVVLYGVIAWVALRYRKLAIAAAAFLSVTVGLGTVYLDTHWFSDVVGGWIAGALVLLVLPTVLPTAQRWVDAALGSLRTRAVTAGLVKPARPHPTYPAVHPHPVIQFRPRRRFASRAAQRAGTHAKSRARRAALREGLDDPVRARLRAAGAGERLAAGSAVGGGRHRRGDGGEVL